MLRASICYTEYSTNKQKVSNLSAFQRAAVFAEYKQSMNGWLFSLRPCAIKKKKYFFFFLKSLQTPHSGRKTKY